MGLNWRCLHINISCPAHSWTYKFLDQIRLDVAIGNNSCLGVSEFQFEVVGRFGGLARIGSFAENCLEWRCIFRRSARWARQTVFKLNATSSVNRTRYKYNYDDA